MIQASNRTRSEHSQRRPRARLTKTARAPIHEHICIAHAGSPNIKACWYICAVTCMHADTTARLQYTYASSRQTTCLRCAVHVCCAALYSEQNIRMSRTTAPTDMHRPCAGHPHVLAFIMPMQTQAIMIYLWPLDCTHGVSVVCINCALMHAARYVKAHSSRICRTAYSTMCPCDAAKRAALRTTIAACAW